MSLRKILVSALCAFCAVSLLVPAAFAHGGCRGRYRRTVQPCAVLRPYPWTYPWTGPVRRLLRPAVYGGKLHPDGMALPQRNRLLRRQPCQRLLRRELELLPYHFLRLLGELGRSSRRLPQTVSTITFGEDLSVERPSLFTLPPFVFFSGGDPAAYMALGLVFVEDFLDLLVQVPVDGRQAFTEVLMYGRL